MVVWTHVWRLEVAGMSRLRWGMVGGGEGSQIGFTHRAAAELDREFELVAGAFDIDPDRSRSFGHSLGLDFERVYGDWQSMLAAESDCANRLDLVTIATPNNSHFEICRAFLQAGFHVLCEKPLTITRENAQELHAVAATGEQICAVNFGYTGYPLVRQMRAMVINGELGKVRLVKTEFAAGFLADAQSDTNPRVRWRFDPELAGPSCVMADMGSHAMHLACFTTGQQIKRLSADFANGVQGRQLEDDASVVFRMEGGTIGRLWVSGIALGKTHGLSIQIFGEQGGLCWNQEHPDQLLWTPLNGSLQILERGTVSLAPEAQTANRLAVGHPEGMVLAFANIYRDLAASIRTSGAGSTISPRQHLFPSVVDGRHMVDVVCIAVQSSKAGSQWLDVPTQEDWV